MKLHDAHSNLMMMNDDDGGAGGGDDDGLKIDFGHELQPTRNELDTYICWDCTAASQPFFFVLLYTTDTLRIL